MNAQSRHRNLPAPPTVALVGIFGVVLISSRRFLNLLPSGSRSEPTPYAMSFLRRSVTAYSRPRQSIGLNHLTTSRLEQPSMLHRVSAHHHPHMTMYNQKLDFGYLYRSTLSEACAYHDESIVPASPFRSLLPKWSHD